MSPPSSNAESTRERERDPNRPLDISAPFHPQHNPYPLPQQQQQYQQYQYSPDPSSHMAGSPNASDDGTRGLVPPSQSFGGVSRAESASSGLSAGTAGREMSGLGYGGFDPSAPSPTQAYLDSFEPPSAAYNYNQQGLRAGQGGDGGYGAAQQYHQSQYSPNTNSPAFGNTGETERLGQGTANYSYPSRLQSFSKERYSDQDHSGAGVAAGTVGTMGYSDTPRDTTGADKGAKRRKWLCIGIPVVVVVAAAVAVGVYFGTRKSGTSSGSNGSSGAGSGGSGSGSGGSSGTGNGSGNGQGTASNNVFFGVKGSGATGSTVTTDLNTTFTYTNTFGGNWAQDPMNPYSVSGKAQSWSPAITEEWKWGQDIVRGVNLGGWLVTEPFIVPALYEAYQNATPQAVDEYTLSQALGDKLGEVMEEHYKTFITEQDFATIAQYGLNWVRIPIGFWAIEKHADEPYLEGVSWTYFLKAISWGRKYGIRILLDFHALPGSQNGWNHSGRSGTPGQAGAGVNFMYGAMGIANAERHLEQLRSLTQFISQDGIKEVVPMIGLVNEIQAQVVGKASMEAYYYRAYNMIRSITGYGAGNGPMIAMHEGFFGIGDWNTFMPGADRLVLDQHPYLAFGDPNTETHASRTSVACNWAGGTNDTMNSWGVVVGGEWSNAVNNCGKWLNGVGGGNSYNSIPNSLGCQYWEDWQKWTPQLKQDIMNYNLAQMDALTNFMFWTWKIGVSQEFGYATSPQWHYKLGVEQGWITSDPRRAAGFCRSRGAGGGVFSGTFPASATGGIATSQPISGSATLAPWPPAVISPFITAQAQVALLPRLTQTGSPITMPTAAHPSGVQVGDGWAFKGDTRGAYVAVAGCSYPNKYDAAAPSDLPASRCAAWPTPETAAPAAATAGGASPSPTTPPAVAQTTAAAPAPVQTTAAQAQVTAVGGANPATPLGQQTAR